YSHHEGPGHAGPLPARPGPRGGNDRRSELDRPEGTRFRKERSCADAIRQCFNTLARTNSPRWVLEGDIQSCFDRISHDWLLAHIPMEKAILQKRLKAGYMDHSLLYPTDEGTPQGGIITPPTMLPT